MTERAARTAALLAMASLVTLAVPTPASAQETIVVWHAYGESEEAGLLAAVALFERAHPDVHVDLVASPFGAFASRLRNAIPTGHGPDLFIDAHNRLPSFVDASLLEDFGALSPELTADLPPALVGALTYEGTLYGVPLSLKSLALYVSDELAMGRTLPSLEDYAALRRELPDGTYAIAWEVDSTYASVALFHAYGARVLDEEGRFAAATPEGDAALAELARLVADGSVPAEASGDLVRDLFRSGRAVAAISGPWLAPDLPASLHYHVLPLPIVHAADDGLMVPYSTIDAALIPAGSPHPELARELAAFLASPAGSIARATAGHQIVASVSAWHDPGVASDERLVAFHDAALAAMPMPTHPHMDSVFGPMDRAIRKVLRGDATPHDALAEAEHRFVDETRPAPPLRDPTFAVVALMLGLFAALAMVTSRLRDPAVRASLVRSMPAYGWVMHAFVAVGLLVVLPLAVGAMTSLYAGQDLHYVGLANYFDILTNRGGDLLGHGSFWLVLGVTVLWTITNVIFHVGIGIGLALLLHRPTVKLRTLYRILLVVPWAVPSYVTALAWRGMFHRQLGAINAILAVFGVEPVSWFAHFSTAFTANLATNVWLGFPFMMVVTLGALTSIPKDLYEAADVDGASAFQKLTRITLPMLRPALLPAVAMGAVWTFNMFNVVFLVSAGEPDGSTEILVSEAYRWAFTRGHQVGYAAAYAVLIFVILVGLTRALPRERAPGAR